MAKIFEILNSEFLATPLSFTVDTSVAQVVASMAIPSGDYCRPSGVRWFEPGDNLVITGMSINFPYSFGAGSGDRVLNIVWRDSVGNVTFPAELSGSGNMFIPDPCSVLDLPPDGIFLATPTGVGRVKLTLFGVTLNVSMLNVPAILNGTVQNIGTSLRLFHTRAMSAVP